MSGSLVTATGTHGKDDKIRPSTGIRSLQNHITSMRQIGRLIRCHLSELDQRDPELLSSWEWGYRDRGRHSSGVLGQHGSERISESSQSTSKHSSFVGSNADVERADSHDLCNSLSYDRIGTGTIQAPGRTVIHSSLQATLDWQEKEDLSVKSRSESLVVFLVVPHPPSRTHSPGSEGPFRQYRQVERTRPKPGASSVQSQIMASENEIIEDQRTVGVHFHPPTRKYSVIYTLPPPSSLYVWWICSPPL